MKAIKLALAHQDWRTKDLAVELGVGEGTARRIIDHGPSRISNQPTQIRLAVFLYGTLIDLLTKERIPEYAEMLWWCYHGGFGMEPGARYMTFYGPENDIRARYLDHDWNALQGLPKTLPASVPIRHIIAYRKHKKELHHEQNQTNTDRRSVQLHLI